MSEQDVGLCASWIERFDIGWWEKRNIYYKGVETSPLTCFKTMKLTTICNESKQTMSEQDVGRCVSWIERFDIGWREERNMNTPELSSPGPAQLMNKPYLSSPIPYSGHRPNRSKQKAEIKTTALFLFVIFFWNDF